MAGIGVALLFPAAGFWMRDMSMVWPGPLAAFLFFRLFDIWKPWPVRWADRELHGGFGAMADDALAGLLAFGVLQSLARFLPL